MSTPRGSLRLFVIIGILSLAGGSLSGCSPPAGSENTPTLFPSSVPTATLRPSTPTPQPTVEAPAPENTPAQVPQEQNRPQYRISARLDYPNQRLTVQERILVPHPAVEVLDQIQLVVPPGYWPGVFSLENLSSPNIDLEGYSMSGVKLLVDISPPGWAPGEDLVLEISYVLELPQINSQASSGPSAFGYSVLQTNLVDWYPMVPPYQDQAGWVIHDPWIFGEYLVYPAADFEISFDPGSADLVVAASSLPVGSEIPLTYEIERSRNFVLSISPSYQVLEGEINGVKVVEYHFPGYRIPAQAALETSLEAWSLFETLYGTNHQDSLTIIQADFYHGVEFEGGYFQSRGFYDTYPGSEKSFLVAIAAHETAHQWWYGQVANDQALEPWLDEALCTFSELAFYENLHPGSLDWWWSTRVNYYQPVGDLEGSIYDFTQYTDQYLMYRNATYLQGAKFLSGLKDTMGNDTLFDFLSDYQASYQDQIASQDDFFDLLGEYLDLSGQNWIQDYFPSRFGE